MTDQTIPKGYDMSEYWRLVSVDGGPLTDLDGHGNAELGGLGHEKACGAGVQADAGRNSGLTDGHR